MNRFLVVLLACVTMATAQALGPEYGTMAAPVSSFLSSSPLTQQVMNDPIFKSGLEGNGKSNSNSAVAITFRATGHPPTMPARLAQAYPAAKRAEVERVFNTLLGLYPKVEQYYGWPHNDLAGAVTVFLVSSYQAARAANVEDPQVKTLVAQLRSVLAANAGIAQATDAAKQEMYEQMVILGMFTLGVQDALKKTPNPQIAANLKTSGTDYLRAFLGVEPENISIGASGMTMTTNAATNTAQPSASPATPVSRAAGAASPTLSTASRLTDKIETVGFYTQTGMGYGGMLTFNPTPIVLFKSGEALYDMEALKFPAGLAAHKASHPKDWTKWRRANNAIEVIGSKGWEKITYTKTMDRLPPGFTLAGSYQKLGGVGNLAVGGTSAVAVWNDLTFDRTGNFASGGGSGASTRTEGAGSATSVVTASRAPDQRGRYAIEGYTLMLNYTDGRVERRMIVTDRADPSVIWLDGDGYTKKK
jgi:hypothetical protein